MSHSHFESILKKGIAKFNQPKNRWQIQFSDAKKVRTHTTTKGIGNRPSASFGMTESMLSSANVHRGTVRKER